LELVERRNPLGHDEARDIQSGDIANTLFAESSRQGLQILRLRLSDVLDASGLDVFVVAGEGQPRLLHPGPQNRPIEAVITGDDLERQIFELRRQERADRPLDEVFLRRHGDHGKPVGRWPLAVGRWPAAYTS